MANVINLNNHVKYKCDEQLLSKDVIDFLDKLFPIEYNELNFEEYQEYMTLVLQILNKLSFDIDFDRNWIVILQNIVDKQKKDVVNSLKPTWFRTEPEQNTIPPSSAYK